MWLLPATGIDKKHIDSCDANSDSLRPPGCLGGYQERLGTTNMIFVATWVV